MTSLTGDPQLIGDDIALAHPRAPRARSIDGLRGAVMFVMIFVNDLNGDRAPPWMKHFEGKNGMTFVDLVFPAFLFIVGMSIPLALSPRLKRREPIWKLAGHILVRALSLMLIGVMMVHAEAGPSTARMGWSGTLWTGLMFTSAIGAFCSIRFPRRWGRRGTVIANCLTAFARACGFAALIYLAFAYRGRHNERIITLLPLAVHPDWYGILGIIGWAYLVAAIVFLIFRTNRTALLFCAALAMSLYYADRYDAFTTTWLGRHLAIGELLGSQASVVIAGVILGSILLTPDTATHKRRIIFTILFAAACAFAAYTTYHPWGISKDNATPAWCLWACCATSLLWLLFYLVADVASRGRYAAMPFAIAGQNVLLAYLLSEAQESALKGLHLADWYDTLGGPTLSHAIARSLSCAAIILLLTALLNRAGFRLKL